MLDHFETAERDQALLHILEAVDLEIMNEILTRLSSPSQIEFLSLCLTRHHHPSLLEWLEQKFTGISQHIQAKAAATHSQLKIILVTI